jgi:hypothetical protein
VAQSGRPVALPLLVCLALLSPLLYPVSYAALATPQPFYPCLHGMSGGPHLSRIPVYRFGGETAEVVFRPLEALDRRVRPAYWAGSGLREPFIY